MPTASDATSFRAVIELWPSRQVLADSLELNYTTVAAWFRRDSIPSAYWDVLLVSAQAHDVSDLSYPLLHEIARRNRTHRLRDGIDQGVRRAAKLFRCVALNREVTPHGA